MKTQLIKISTILLCVISVSCTAQDKQETAALVKLLQKEHIDLNGYALIENNTITSYFEGFTIINSPDSVRLKNIAITKGISFNTYKYVPSDYSKFHHENFSVGKDIFTIDNIVQQNNIDLKYYNPYFYLRGYYVFSKGTDNVVIIEAENRTFYRDKEVFSYFVIDVSDGVKDIKLLYDVEN